jgi:hypothetical protein
MRLIAIELENFKGIGPRQRIELAPITLLFGPNSAGKSTILQALHYVREILERQNVDPDMTIAGGMLDLGGFRSVVHKRDLMQPVRIKLELNFSPFESLEHIPINSDGPDVVGGDFTGLDVPYIGWERTASPVPVGTLLHVALDLELRWSAQHIAPYVARWAVDLNYHPVAAISSAPEEGRAILGEFNFSHPLLAAELQDDDAPRPSPVETLIRDLSREIAIHESKAPLTPIDARVAVKTVFGALPDLNDELIVDLRDPEVRKLELEGKTRRAIALTALLSEIMLGPARIIRDYLSRSIYIGPLREIPARDYIPQFSPDESRWAHGLAAWDLLHGPRGRELIEKVNFWLFDKERFNSGYRLERVDYRKVPSPGPIDIIFQRGLSDEDLPELQELFEQCPIEQEVVLRDIRTGTLVGPSDVGVGLSQLVPVIVSIVSGDDGLVAIEQPELHIHPAVQVGVGDLFAASASGQSSDVDAERCLLIETHSEHIMLRLLRRIRETSENQLPPDAPSLTPGHVAVIYVEPTEDALRLTPLRIASDGDFLDRWPRGFFAERGEELF